MRGLNSTQKLPFQSYLLYPLRFILAARMVSSWKMFGGISAQINALGAIMNIAVVENAGIAIAYDLALRKFIAQLARRRRYDFSCLLSEECHGGKNKYIHSDHSNQMNPSPKGKERKGQRAQ